MMQISEKHNGFQNEADYEDVKKFLSFFKLETNRLIETYGFIGKCVMALDPVANSGGKVVVGKTLDPASRAYQVSIPLTLVSASREPRGSANALEVALLEATALSVLKGWGGAGASRGAAKESKKNLLGPQPFPQFSSDDVAAYAAQSEEDIAAQLIGKLRDRAQRSPDTAPAKGLSKPKA